jgi:CRP-like cAMP-binding protein
MPPRKNKPQIIFKETLKTMGLFKSVTDKELQYFQNYIPHKITEYEKGDILLMFGEQLDDLGILLTGSVSNKNISAIGVEFIGRRYEPGDIIGFAAVATLKRTAPFAIIAEEKSSVLWIDYNKLTTITPASANLIRKVNTNKDNIYAEEIIRLLVKIEVLSKYSVREKLITYLAIISRKRESTSFTLSMNITELANYLCVARQNLSRSISELKNEGLIDLKGKEVTLLSDGISSMYGVVDEEMKAASEKVLSGVSISTAQLKNTKLFQNITDDEFRYFREQVPQRIVEYSKGDIVIAYGQHLSDLGILLTGIASNKTIGTGGVYINERYATGDAIGFAAAATVKGTAPYTIVAEEKCRILWMDYKKLTDSPGAGTFITKINLNKDNIFAEEIISLLVKVEVLSKYNIRSRLITYLAIMSRKKGKNTFSIGMNITELANYLCVSRENLSRHISELADKRILKLEGKIVSLLSDEIEEKYSEMEMK